MKVLVTGGSGFVGQEVLYRLEAEGHFARALARNPQSPAAHRMTTRCKVEIHQGDIVQPESLRAAVDGIEAVIHLVGIISEVGDQTFENVHARATQNMVAAAHATGMRRFLHMSALGTRANAAARYHQTKWAAEEEVRRSGLDYTLFRPSLIYGPQDQFANVFAKIARLSPIVPVFGNPNTSRCTGKLVLNQRICLTVWRIEDS